MKGFLLRGSEKNVIGKSYESCRIYMGCLFVKLREMLL